MIAASGLACSRTKEVANVEQQTILTNIKAVPAGLIQRDEEQRLSPAKMAK